MNKKLLVLFFIAGLISFLPISCDIKNPVEGITVRVKNIPRTTSVRVEFIDQLSRNLVTNQFVIKFFGRNKNDVISDVNVPLSEMTVKDGIAYFSIKDNIIPSTQNPVEIVIVTQNSQYHSTSSRLIITKPGSSTFSVNMLKIQASYPSNTGISKNEQSFGNVALPSGTTTNIIATSGGALAATLTVPAGTILRDANGNILSGNVTTQITYFDAVRPTAIPSFPGGFSVTTNTTGTVSFVTGGFAAINMSVNGVPVESFSNNATVRIQVNPNTRNPITGTTVRPGDIIPMWSYNESTGSWKFEGNYSVNSAVGSGGQTLYVEKTDVTHLSWWNIDWYFNPCPVATPIRFVANGCWSTLYWYLEYSIGQGNLGWGTVHFSDPIIHLMNAPENFPVRLLVFDDMFDMIEYWNTGNTSLPVGSTTIVNLCSGPSNLFSVAVNIPSSIGQTVNITIRGVCPNGNIVDQGTFDIEILKNGYWEYAGRVVNGQVTLDCMQIGQTYNFRIYYNQQYYYGEQQITSTNMLLNIPLPGNIDFCQ
jgi:hypothetical protein